MDEEVATAAFDSASMLSATSRADVFIASMEEDIFPIDWDCCCDPPLTLFELVLI